MEKIYGSAMELIGHTPLVRMDRYARAQGIADGVLLAKAEYFNPAGSVKDRVASAMIQDAERKGILKPGAAIIEPTSGNTGIGLAMAASRKGISHYSYPAGDYEQGEKNSAESLWRGAGAYGRAKRYAGRH